MKSWFASTVIFEHCYPFALLPFDIGLLSHFCYCPLPAPTLIIYWTLILAACLDSLPDSRLCFSPVSIALFTGIYSGCYYGVKTVSNPPTNARKRTTLTHTIHKRMTEIHTHAHNPQMHTRDPHSRTQFTNALKRSTLTHTIQKCTQEIHTHAHNPQMHTRDPHSRTQSSNALKRSTLTHTIQKCTQEIHTHNPQMHAKDPQGNTKMHARDPH